MLADGGDGDVDVDLGLEFRGLSSGDRGRRERTTEMANDNFSGYFGDCGDDSRNSSNRRSRWRLGYSRECLWVAPVSSPPKMECRPGYLSMY